MTFLCVRKSTQNVHIFELFGMSEAKAASLPFEPEIRLIGNKKGNSKEKSFHAMN